MTTTTINTVRVNGRTLAYREAGSGIPVVLLHGWPTSSLLWRGVQPAIARHNRVLALDLPGLGASEKPADVKYDFAFMTGAVRGFCDALELEPAVLVGHDLGGPIAARFALDHPDRVRSVALLNTLLHPEYMNDQLTAFVEALKTPGERQRFTSDEAIEIALRLGTAREESVTEEAIEGMVAPFSTDEDRVALAKAGSELEDEGFEDIARRLGELAVPVRVIFGGRDRILPAIAETMHRIQRDVPDAELTELPDSGHFLQEDDPAQVGELLAEFAARG